jgi:hypothetical protein
MSGLPLRLIFDVESVGLHGEGFAVGWVVMEADKEIDSGYAACSPDYAYEGSKGDRIWVSNNVVPHLPPPTIKNSKEERAHAAPAKLRQVFWDEWLRWKEKGATLWADCAWPVEARFLIECVQDGTDDRNWLGPYPLCEISTVLIYAGLDPLTKRDRLPSEKPAHHPTCDARQSARLLIEALATIKESSRVDSSKLASIIGPISAMIGHANSGEFIHDALDGKVPRQWFEGLQQHCDRASLSIEELGAIACTENDEGKDSPGA